MSQVGCFWFVPANLRRYSALVADMVPIDEAPDQDGLRVGLRNQKDFWDELALRDVRWLRRHGWPVSVAGRTANDFPGGTVAYNLALKRSVLTVDPALASPAFVRELSAHFGFEHKNAIVRQSIRTTIDCVAPPKPWY